MSAVVCGLDVHKDSTYATILNPEGKVINQSRMTNEKVPSYLSHFKVGKVAIEASTSVASIYRQLVSEGFDVVVSHPKKTRYIAEARIKSDRVDSKVIGELARLDALPYYLLGVGDRCMPQSTGVKRGTYLEREGMKKKNQIRDFT
jgi:transposase